MLSLGRDLESIRKQFPILERCVYLISNSLGAVSLDLPYAFSIKQALEQRKVKVDFRKGEYKEPDVIRVGPHFYTNEREIDVLFREIDEIYDSGEFKKFSEEVKHVT